MKRKRLHRAVVATREGVTRSIVHDYERKHKRVTLLLGRAEKLLDQARRILYGEDDEGNKRT